MLKLSLFTARSKTADGILLRIQAEEGRWRLAQGALLERGSFLLVDHDLSAGRVYVGAIVHPARTVRIAVEAAVAALLAGGGWVVSGVVTAITSSHPGN